MLLIASAASAKQTITQLPDGTECYPRRTVMEEGTGTWCGWCVRGIVCLEEMKQKYPDNFIGIAIHSSDEMEYAYGLTFNSYPSAYYNRSKEQSVSQFYAEQEISQAGLTTKAMVEVLTINYSLDYSTFTVNTRTRYGTDFNGTDYRLVYVVTEDNVGPFAQNNYYAGGEYGEMGGYETKPGRIKQLFNDVARAVYPSCTGDMGSVPSNLTAQTDYNATATFAFPSNIQNADNLFLTVLLYDAQSNEILNADRIPFPKGRKPIEQTLDMQNNTGKLSELLGDKIWLIESLTLTGPINGDDLFTLRQMMGCGTSQGESSSHNSLKTLDLSGAEIVSGGTYIRQNKKPVELKESNILPSDVFYGSTSLRRLVTPTTLHSIGSSALYNCTFLLDIVLNEGLEEIKSHAFSCCKILETIHIPSTVSTFNATIFADCSFLSSVTIEPSNPFLYTDGRIICTADLRTLIYAIPSTTGVIHLSDKCEQIGAEAFYRNETITGIIGRNIKRIEYGAIWSNINLEFLALGCDTEYIDCLNYASNLKHIYLGCKNIPDGNYSDYPGYWNEISACTLYVPTSAIETFRAHPYWSQMKDILPIEDTPYAYMADPTLPSSIDTHRTSASLSTIYDLSGRPVNGSSRGIRISGGKKLLIK